ncbi:hypothetical protein ACFOEK_06950 [Litoribrevibacter euphylliae]|uniref:Uncharacterized protein n=1 Tax=Litoribrevibacter euphylliae TaxID=1834034 RepID=A0ABV7HDX5_9GAMM
MFRLPIFFFTLMLSFSSSAEKIYEPDVKLKANQWGQSKLKLAFELIAGLVCVGCTYSDPN